MLRDAAGAFEGRRVGIVYVGKSRFKIQDSPNAGSILGWDWDWAIAMIPCFSMRPLGDLESLESFKIVECGKRQIWSDPVRIYYLHDHQEQA